MERRRPRGGTHSRCWQTATTRQQRRANRRRRRRPRPTEAPRAIGLEPPPALPATRNRDRPSDVGAALSSGQRLAGVTAALATASVLLLAGAASLIPAMLTDADCSPVGDADARPSASATETIPARYLALYQQADTAYAVPWAPLAAIGAIESDHGRSN